MMFISSHWYVVWIAGHNEWASLIYIDCIGSYVCITPKQKNPQTPLRDEICLMVSYMKTLVMRVQKKILW